MPELLSLLKKHDQARSAGVINFKKARKGGALSHLMHLSFLLEPAGHYCGHGSGKMGKYS